MTNTKVRTASTSPEKWSWLSAGGMTSLTVIRNGQTVWVEADSDGYDNGDHCLCRLSIEEATALRDFLTVTLSEARVAP